MPTWLLSALAFASAHQAVLTAALIALIDLLFAIKPEWKSNGLLHMLYLKLTSKTSIATPDKE